MKNSKSIRSGVEIGLIYSIITIGLGVIIGLLLTISEIVKTNSIVSVIRLIVNFMLQNNYSSGYLGIRMPNNILLLLLMGSVLYHLTKKKLQSYKRYDVLSYIVAASLIISVITVLFQLICTYIEATSIDAVIDFTNLFGEYSIIIIRQFILYGIMLYVLFMFSNRKTLIESGYQALFTYVKYLLLAMFLFSVVVVIDLFFSISVNGRIEGLGETVRSVNFSGKTAVLAMIGLLVSIGNVTGFLTGIIFGGNLVQEYIFLNQNETNRIGLYEILAGQLGKYSNILFIVCLLCVVSIIIVAASRLQRKNYWKHAFILMLGVMLINVIIVELSSGSFEFKEIIKIRFGINTVPVAIISLLGAVIAISIRYIFLTVRKIDEKDVVS